MLPVVDMMQSPEISPSNMASLTKRFSKGADLTGRLPMNSSRLKFSLPSPVEGGRASTKALGLNIERSEMGLGITFVYNIPSDSYYGLRLIVILKISRNVLPKSYMSRTG